MKPFNYVTEANFQDRVDLSVPGMMQDCAECHVGGGAMEYVPAPDLDTRTSLRDIATADVNGYGPITGYTAFNYFIDTYDVDGDGNLNEVQPANFAQLGVIEMDCFLCHLKGYDYQGRVAMQRAAKFDASRAVGAGVAMQNNVGFGTAGYGTEVYYNDLVVSDGTNLSFGSTIIANLKASPPSDNCAFCHFNHGSVDWKKRGDNWKNNPNYDVHTVLGCMGCHEGKVGSEIGTSGDPSSLALGQCDPARGYPPYSSIWASTKGTIKTCADCHLKAGYDEDLGTYSNDFGAPDPTARHAALGFTAEICQTKADGNVNASHLDILQCTVCHVRKASTAAWNTGGAIVDATGPDAAGRLADHENAYVSRAMYDGGTDTTNLSYAWHMGQIYPASVLTTIYWRDKDKGLDANGDGQRDKQDALLMTDVLETNQDNNWAAGIIEDNGGVFDNDKILERITALNTFLDDKWSTTGDTDGDGEILYEDLDGDGILDVAEDLNGNGLLDTALDEAADGVDYNSDGDMLDIVNEDVDGDGNLDVAEDVDSDGILDLETQADVKLASLAVAFKVNHNVSPATKALGHACTDCHDTGKFFDKVYSLKGDDMDVTGYSKDADLVTAWTKVNDPQVGTEFHQNLKERTGTSSIPLGILTDAVDPFEVYPYQMLYPATLTTSYVAENGGTYGTGSSWAGYLASIGGAPGNYIGPANASILTDLSSPFEVGDTIFLAANNSADGSQFYWNIQDRPGTISGQGVAVTPPIPDPLPVGALPYTLNNPGTFQVLLTVVGPTGDLKQQVASITVARQVAATTGAVSSVVGSTVTLTLSNLPALADYDQLYIRYGDGTWETVAADAVDDNTQVVVRDYRLRPTYFDGTSYNYVTTVQVKNGGVVVETVKFSVTVTP